MIDEKSLPDTPLERAVLLQHILLNRATKPDGDDQVYKRLRAEFMEGANTRALLPPFVRTCRDLGQFWSFISETRGWEPRRKIIYAGFRPLLDYLEGTNRAPADASISDALATFDPEGVHAAWGKALQRRQADPEGAITMARTLLETVCKRILEEAGEAYKDTDDLPVLYGTASKKLNLAPSQHTEETFKAILGNCHQIVERLGTLRNKIGDAHGKGGKPVKPGGRHAHLAVNLAGTMATFLVETWQARAGAGDGVGHGGGT